MQRNRHMLPGLEVCSMFDAMVEASPVVAEAEQPPVWPAVQWVQLLPYGVFVTVDGRPFEVNQHSVKAVAEAFGKRKNDLVLDYMHSTENPNLGDAPAAGWIKELEWRLPGDATEVLPSHGLWARVEWTSRAQERLAAREYRYISPVIKTQKPGKDKTAPLVVIEIVNAALVNDPAIDGMEPVAFARQPEDPEGAALDNVGATDDPGAKRGAQMENLLKALGVATADEAIAQFAALRDQVAQLTASLTSAQDELARIKAVQSESDTKVQAMAAERDSARQELAELKREALIAKYKVRLDEKREKFARTLWETSEGLCQEFLDGLDEPKPSTQVPPAPDKLALGRSDASAPAMTVAEGMEADDEELKRLAAIEALAAARKVPFETALRIYRAENK